MLILSVIRPYLWAFKLSFISRDYLLFSECLIDSIAGVKCLFYQWKILNVKIVSHSNPKASAFEILISFQADDKLTRTHSLSLPSTFHLYASMLSLNTNIHYHHNCFQTSTKLSNLCGVKTVKISFANVIISFLKYVLSFFLTWTMFKAY